MRTNKLIRSVTLRKIQAGLMMVPPPNHFESMAMVDPTIQNSRGTVRLQHSPDSSRIFCLNEGGELVKTKLTTGCLSPTIITSQHTVTTFLRLHFQHFQDVMMKEGVKRDGGMSVIIMCSQLGRQDCQYCPKCSARQHINR